MMKKLLMAITVVVAVFLGYLYYTPYLAVNGLIKAVEAQNTDKVSEYIDFESVKTNVNDQIQALAMKKIMTDPRMQNKEMANMVVAILPKMIDGFTSVIVSPTGMTKMLGGINPVTSNVNQQNGNGGVTPSDEGTVVTKLRDGKGKYLELNRFQLTVMSNKNLPINMIFERKGLTEWKMKKMALPEEVFN